MYSVGDRTKRRLPVLVLVMVAASVATVIQARPKPSPPGSDTVACKAMEAKASRQFGVRLVVFHYRDAADRSRLGKLLRQYDGGSVQFQAGDGRWRQATVLRLKTCFGRGLLVFSLSAAPMAEGSEFLLRFPPGPTPPLTEGVRQGQ